LLGLFSGHIFPPATYRMPLVMQARCNTHSSTSNAPATEPR
jgi:hypothetical protein